MCIFNYSTTGREQACLFSTPGYPHQVIQRDNRRQQTFFCDENYSAYIKLTLEWCKKCNVELWDCCLMPNHVHLIAVPENKDVLCHLFGKTHRRYTNLINTREKWTGYLKNAAQTASTSETWSEIQDKNQE